MQQRRYVHRFDAGWNGRKCLVDRIPDGYRADGEPGVPGNLSCPLGDRGYAVDSVAVDHQPQMIEPDHVAKGQNLVFDLVKTGNVGKVVTAAGITVNRKSLQPDVDDDRGDNRLAWIFDL